MHSFVSGIRRPSSTVDDVLFKPVHEILTEDLLPSFPEARKGGILLVENPTPSSDRDVCFIDQACLGLYERVLERHQQVKQDAFE